MNQIKIHLRNLLGLEPVAWLPFAHHALDAFPSVSNPLPTTPFPLLPFHYLRVDQTIDNDVRDVHALRAEFFSERLSNRTTGKARGCHGSELWGRAAGHRRAGYEEGAALGFEEFWEDGLGEVPELAAGG